MFPTPASHDPHDRELANIEHSAKVSLLIFASFIEQPDFFYLLFIELRLWITLASLVNMLQLRPSLTRSIFRIVLMRSCP